jgi:hypothetical protein
MIKIAKDILADSPVFATAVLVITNSDGSISFSVEGGGYLSQEPNQYGVFHVSPNIGPYEKYTPNGAMVFTSWTRPQDGQFTYTMLSYHVYGYN